MFLDSEPYSNMDEVLKREGCHKVLPLEDRKRKFKELSVLVISPEIVD